MLEKHVGRCGPDSSGSEYEPVVDTCEHANETPGSIKGREFLGQVSDYYGFSRRTVFHGVKLSQYFDKFRQRR
jgi:hypothetical protein